MELTALLFQLGLVFPFSRRGQRSTQSSRTVKSLCFEIIASMLYVVNVSM